jgi:hypothetical protein
LIQRATLPRTPASITLPSESSKMKVCAGSSGSLAGRSQTISHVVRSPRYSMICVPLAIGVAANTPGPWMDRMANAIALLLAGARVIGRQR